MATPPDFSVGQVLTSATMNQVGLWKITPTSVSGTGATINATGDVVVTSGSTSVTVNGIFSDNFENYLFSVSGFRGSGATGLFVSMGTVRSGTSHKFGGVSISSGGALSSDSSAGADAFSTGIVTRGSADTAGGEFKLFGPFRAEETSFTAAGNDSDNSALGRFLGGRHMLNTSYTAVIFGTFGGVNINACRISVYGYR
jgi:hypothetical protein